jgi:DnaJ-class molecular chaperone
VTQSQGQGGVRVEYGDLNDIFGEGSFSDFFTQIFGGMGGGTRTQTRRTTRPAGARAITSIR